MTEDQIASYDYAWDTPGFTAQNQNIRYGIDGYVDPGMPTDVSQVRVYGKFMEMDTGRSLEGMLRLRINKMLVHQPTGTQVMPGELRPIRFKRRGFSIYLPATDDPELTPEFTYEARLTVRGVTQEFSFALPAESADYETPEGAEFPQVNVTHLIPVS